MSLPRIKSSRERRNLSVDASIVAAAMPDPMPFALRSPAMATDHLQTTPSSDSSQLSSSYNLLSPRNLPASVDREIVVDGPHVKSAVHVSSSCYLAYGMVVSCLSTDRSGLLASEGLTSVELRMDKLAVNTKQALDAVDQAMNGQSIMNLPCQLVTTHFKDCLFEVIPKMSYDATNRFLEAKTHPNAHSTESTAFSDEYSDLKFKSESELRLNINIYQKLHGTKVKYGQVIQLRHIKSGLFVSTSLASRTSADSVEVHVAPGSSLSHFTLMPRFKLRKTGEPVQMIDQVVLSSADKVHKTSLYVSNRKSQDVNAALVVGSTSFSSQWRFLPYDQSSKDVSTVQKYQQDFGKGLKAGHCIRLFHLEMSSWLGSLGRDNRVCLHTTFGESADGEAKQPTIDDRTQMLSPNTLWEIERTTMFQGGVLSWSHHIHLRHVVTGLYLAVREHQLYGPNICLQPQPESFLLCPTTLGGSRSSVGLNSAVQLLHLTSGHYIHASQEQQIEVSDDVDDRGSLACRVNALTDAQDQDAFKIIPVSQAEMENTLLLASYRRVFDKFLMFFGSTDNGATSPMDETILLAQVRRAMDGLKNFTVSETQGFDHITALRQSLLRQHRFVALLTDMLRAPFVPFGGPYSLEYVSSFYIDTKQDDEIFDLGGITMTLDSPPQLPTSPANASCGDAADIPSKFRLSVASMRTLNRVICEINVLLFRIFYSSRTSDAASCRRALPVLVQFLGHKFHASVPLSYLIQEKFYLSESFASFSSLIRNFLNLIKTQGKSARYVQFLVVLCTADGHAIPKIQEKICELLFNPLHGFTDAVLLETRPLSGSSGFEICIPSTANDGVEWMPLAEFYEEYYELEHHSTLAPYFYGLLQLYGALCMDRNYMCINSLKEKFPRGCLVAAIQDSKLSRSIRAVLLNLLLVLHVDCEPLKSVPSPNYTRIWRDVVTAKATTIPMAQEAWYTTQDWMFFDNLKAILVGQLNKMDGYIVIAEFPQNTMLLAIVRTCKKLVEFGLFRTFDELSQLVQCLVRLLDCRTDTWNNTALKSLRQSDASAFSSGSSMAVSPVLPRSSESTRFDLNAQNDIIQHTQGNMLDEGIRRDSLDRQYSAKRFESKKTLDRDLKILKWSTSSSVRNANAFATKSQFKMSKWNQVVMDIKDEVCAILLHIDSFRLDHQISSVLLALARSPDHPESICNKSACDVDFARSAFGSVNGSDQVGKAQDTSEQLAVVSRAISQTISGDRTYALSALARRSLDTILLQALMYEHPPLVSKALELLLQQFNQHDQVIKALNNVLLIVDEETVQNYDKLKSDIDQLRQLAETTEVWMDLTSKCDYEVAEHVCQLLKKLTGVLNVSPTAADTTASTEKGGRQNAIIDNFSSTSRESLHMHHSRRGSQVETKRLLRNLDAMQTVVNMLRDGSHYFKIQYPSVLNQSADTVSSPQARHQSLHHSPLQQQSIKRVFSQSMLFLQAMCYENVMSQSFLAENIACLIDFVEELQEAQDLIVEIYSNYIPLCKSVPVKVISKFTALLLAEIQASAPSQLRYAAFLRTIVVCHGESIVENQTLVLSQVVKSPIVLAFLHSCTSQVLQSLDVLVSGKVIDTIVAPFVHHTELAGLFSACARGKDMRLKAMCAGVLPFDQLLHLLETFSSTALHSITFDWFQKFQAGIVDALKDIHLSCDAFNQHPLDEGIQLRLLIALSKLIVQCTCQHVHVLATHDNECRNPPQPHVIFDGGKVFVDVTMTSYSAYYAREKATHGLGMLFTLVIPSLHLIFVHHNVVVHNDQLWKSIYSSLFALLATSIALPVVNALPVDEQDSLLDVLRVLDKLQPIEACGLEMLFYDVSSRTKRPFLGDRIADFNAGVAPIDSIQMLYDAFSSVHEQSSGTQATPLPMARSSTTHNRLSLINGYDIHPVAPQAVKKKGSSVNGQAACWWPAIVLNSAKRYLFLKNDRGQEMAQPPHRSPRQKQMEMFVVKVDHEAAMLDRYFQLVQNDPCTQAIIQNELHHMIMQILSVESALKHESETMTDVPKTTTTLDEIILRLVEHFKLLKYSKFSKVSIILLDVFSHMIKSQDLNKRHQMQVRLDTLGLTSLVVTIISSTTDSVVFDRCVELGISLLDGMNAKVQENFYSIWVDSKSTRFFERIKQRIDKATEVVRQNQDDDVEAYSMKRHRVWMDNVKVFNTSDPNLNIVQVFRFLQLLCEGHFLKIQRYFIAQPMLHTQINLVEATTSFLLEVHGSISSPNLNMIKQLFDTVTEFCQGPCIEAQECIANYKFISAVNELMALLPPSGNVDALGRLRLLKGSIVISLLSLIEGRTDTIIHDRLVTELNFDTLKDNLVRVYKYFVSQYKGVYDGNSSCSTDAYLTMGFNLHILMQHLKEHQPQLALTLQPKHVNVGRQQQSEACNPFSLTWLKQLATKAPETSKTSAHVDDKDVWYSQAYNFFQDKCGRVEIIWRRDDLTHQLVQIYFPVHPICCCLTERSKHRLHATINTTGSNKLADFFSRMPTLLHEMEYHSQLLQRHLITRLAVHTTSMQKLSFALALVLNGIVLATFRARDNESDPVLDIRTVFPGHSDDAADELHAALRILGTCQVIVCSILFVLYCVHTAPVLVMERWYQRRVKLKDRAVNDPTQINRFECDSNDKESLQDVEDLLRSLGDRDVDATQPTHSFGTNAVATAWIVLGDSYLIYVGLLVGFSILGTIMSPLFFSFHLLDVVNRSQDLKSVLQAIFHPGKALLLILALYVLIVYIFAVVGFYYFRSDYTPETKTDPTAPLRCTTLFLCFLTSLDEGFKNNGGLGGYLAPRERGTDPLAYPRLIFDQLYHAILIIVLINISFGLIVDTFATIRTSHKEKVDELHDRCFICSIDGYTFDRLTRRGFDYHTHMEHNMWHYLCLFVHINKKDYTEYNGMELYLAMRMAKADVSFFPNHRAMALERVHDVWSDDAAEPTAHPAQRQDATSRPDANQPPGNASLFAPPHHTVEKQLGQLLDAQHAIRDKQNEMETVQRQLLVAHDNVMKALARWPTDAAHTRPSKPIQFFSQDE
ncbi:hypothetical protein H310_13238 [Aphanomyces invadans]|uniref:MIR domain-containing protein n=1 Tax=Aphanomyces invadans TaxID=157072 RepID=A0A024TEI3_9STRA|nr:hypothetical protein H310_13238 [Aphanomyces invadans]ETV92580.1 hypothetical protein H310_13238 [Aphanomyces invadans]|eukprot:XP_008878887.1 hypothetical protein H310_13238 [Aphanomyces invadans]